MGFTQVIEVETSDAQAVSDHLAAWHAEQSGVAPGYQGYQLLRDRDDPEGYLIMVGFSSVDDAHSNNDRAETVAWAAKLRELVAASPRFRNLDTIARS